MCCVVPCLRLTVLFYFREVGLSTNYFRSLIFLCKETQGMNGCNSRVGGEFIYSSRSNNSAKL